MYNRRLTECFPFGELPPLFECVNKTCFYFETLFRLSETSHKNEWCPLVEDVIAVPLCPSCRSYVKEFEDPDGEIQTVV